jgi:ABC-type cobalamin transport system ATPase subunit
VIPEGPYRDSATADPALAAGEGLHSYRGVVVAVTGQTLATVTVEAAAGHRAAHAQRQDPFSTLS